MRDFLIILEIGILHLFLLLANVPTYIYCNPADESETVEVIQGMNEPHEFKKNGVKWNRVWCNPQVVFEGLEFDVFSSKDFARKTNTTDNLGAIFDRSAEWSDKRAQIAGEGDPVAIRRATDKKIRMAEIRKQAADERKAALKRHREKQ